MSLEYEGKKSNESNITFLFGVENFGIYHDKWNNFTMTEEKLFHFAWIG